MATLETLPRDVALHILRFAFFPDFDYASLSVAELQVLLKHRQVSFDGVEEKQELVELARTSDATSGTESDVNQRGVGRGDHDWDKPPPTVAAAKLPTSLEVPTLPRPEVFVPKRNAPQVPFDPVPVGVTFGSNAVNAAVHISTVSKELKHMVTDDTLWSAPLAALEEAFKAEGDPGTTTDEGQPLPWLFAPTGSDKYRDPRHNESWDMVSAFNQYQVLLNFVKVLWEDFFKACHHDVRSLAESDNGMTWPSSLAQIADHMWQNGGTYHLHSDKERPQDWYEAVFTDATIARMVWNNFSGDLTRGSPGSDYLDILIGGANAFELGYNREMFCCELVPHELEKHGYIKRKPELAREKYSLL